MRELLGCIRRADMDFHMIDDGDSICVGLSGGKDSLSLLKAMALYRKFCPAKFELKAVHLALGLGEEHIEGLAKFCEELDVPFRAVDTKIGDVVMNKRHEKNPCSLCATMRRGRLNDEAKVLGCSKLALGHHGDDAMETLLMSVLQEGRLHTFAPVTYLSRSGVTVIRPMIYAREKDLIRIAKKFDLPVLKSPCPLDGHTRRQFMKELLERMDSEMPGSKNLLFSALRNTKQYGLWDEGSIVRAPIDRNLSKCDACSSDESVDPADLHADLN